MDHYSRLEVSEAQGRVNENVRLERREKGNNEANSILTCLKNHFIFYNLTEAEM